jgi:chaperonin GroES
MSKIPLAPLSERIVATSIEADNKTASGLYLPDGAKEKSKIAKVMATGKAVKEIKSGDKIVYKEYSTTDIKIDGTDYIILKEEDVLATVK